MQKINLRVLAARTQKTKSGKTLYRQSVLIENSQNEEPTVLPLRNQFEESKTLEPGEYTADIKIYGVTITNKSGYPETVGKVYFSNFEKIKQVK